MSRNSSGTYTLPSGNPVVSGSIISSTWANDTMNDIATALTDSLSRSGKGGMTAAFRSIDGVVATPGISFSSETGSGLYRAAAGDVRMAILGADVLAVTAAGAAITGTLNVSGATTLAALGVTNLSYTGTLTGGTGVINIGSGQIYKDASGNVGIGTSSPSYKLHLSTASAVDIETGVTNSAGYSRFGTRNSGNSFAGAFTAGKSLELWSAGSLNALLDSSGNLGLGVTPSGWNTFAAMQLKNASIGGANNETHISGNAYYQSAWKYISNGYAARYSQNDVAGGAHAWFTAPSGTAGNAISFTQAMTLDASGNLGIGTTSPATNLHLYGTASQTALRVENTTNTVYTRYYNTGGDLYLGTDSSTGASFTGTAYARFLYSNGAYPLIFFTNAVERARIDSSGIFTIQNDQLIKNGKGIALYNAANSGYFSLYNSSGTLIFSNGSTQASLSAGGNLTLAGINANTSSQVPNVYVDANGLLYKSTSTGGVGAGQTWTDVTASRAVATTYTNSTGKPIEVALTVSGGSGGGGIAHLSLNGTVAVYMAGNAGVSFVVPNGSTYSVASAQPASWSIGIQKWFELR